MLPQSDPAAQDLYRVGSSFKRETNVALRRRSNRHQALVQKPEREVGGEPSLHELDRRTLSDLDLGR